MARRARLAAIAAETLRVLEAGAYDLPGGEQAEIDEALRGAVDGTVLCGEGEDFADAGAGDEAASLEVTGETSLEAGRRLQAELGAASAQAICVLNFASAKNPGGGFQNGASAQEESLARSSGLFPCLVAYERDFYAENRRDPNGALYSDAMLFSPGVPFFRKDNGEFCELWTASVITCPAPNAGVACRHHGRKEILETMRRRCGRALRLAIARGQTHLVLGAFGCGVFGNDPRDVAEDFHHWLLGPPQLLRHFRHVVFAIPDGADGNHREFAARFGVDPAEHAGGDAEEPRRQQRGGGGGKKERKERRWQKSAGGL